MIAGMACKTLALAAGQAFQRLAALLGDPSPDQCTHCSKTARHWGVQTSQCPLSWGHCKHLPDQLLADPCSLKVCVGSLIMLLRCPSAISNGLCLLRCLSSALLARIWA